MLQWFDGLTFLHKCDSDVMLSKLIFMQYYAKYSVEILVRIIGLGYSV